VARRVRGIVKLEAMGAEVWAPSVDVADAHEMAGVATEIRARFGKLDGVIHAAGVVDERGMRPLAHTDAAIVAAQFRPKIGGVLVLDALVRELRPEFCVLISSLSTIVGGTGYAAYAAANAFLDAHAVERARGGGTAWLSIDWDGFASGDHAGITAAQAERVFARVLAYADRIARIAVSTRDLHARLREAASVETRLAERLATPSAPLAGDFEGEVERDVAGLFADALGVPSLRRDDNFFELGGDSLVGTHILSRLCRSHHVELSLRELFELPTVAGLAARIARKRDAQAAEIARELDDMSDEEIEAELAKRARAQPQAPQE
jgi:acyl carrier protein